MSAKVLVLDSFSFVKFLAVFTIARLLFEARNFFDECFLYKSVIEMKLNNFLVGEFFFTIDRFVSSIFTSK